MLDLGHGPLHALSTFFNGFCGSEEFQQKFGFLEFALSLCSSVGLPEVGRRDAKKRPAAFSRFPSAFSGMTVFEGS
jgi:hypothetical protein